MYMYVGLRVQLIRPTIHRLMNNSAVVFSLYMIHHLILLCARIQQCRLPHGRILGGGTSVNFMVYIRGSPHEFDAWARAGCEGWSFADLLPFFKKSESMQDVRLKDSEYHGFNGPVVVQDRPISPLGDYFVEAAQELGYKALDINGADQEGA